MHSSELYQNSFETEKALEDVGRAMAAADKVLTRLSGEKFFGGRKGSCGLSSDLLVHLLKDVKGMTELKITNVWMIVLSAMGWNKEKIEELSNDYANSNFSRTSEAFIVMQEIFSNAFQHEFVCFKLSGEWYWGDQTFCQFIDPNTEKVADEDIGSELSADDNMVKELLQNGFVKLSLENLRTLLSGSSTQKYRNKFQVSLSVEDILANTPSVATDHSDSELRDLLDQD